jgi:DNA-binding NarL/FixJ family response regulator
MMVVICDKATLFREALASVVTSRGHQVVSCVGALADAVPALEECHPDVMLVDASLVDRDALARLDARRARGTAPRLVLLTGSDDDSSCVADAALETGTADLVLDHTDALRTLEHAVTGRKTTTRPTRRAAPARHADSVLTARERDVMGLLLDGRSTNAIATALDVSRSTVHSHVQSILRKLGAQSRIEAVSIYLGETTSGLGTAR